jgi:NAD(P)-dependent dehydrogenase (short-subunit alcohol dehydrogenase family)
VSDVFRTQLLDGVVVALAGGTRAAVRDKLGQLGAVILEVGGGLEGGVRGLVYDASSAFADGGESGVRAAVDEGWDSVLEVAGDALIAGGAGGRIVLLAPRPRDGAFAEAARAALENVARTLSVEWARYEITTTAITPGDSTTDDEMATLVAFLLSDAGGYFSGCRFSLGEVPAGS